MSRGKYKIHGNDRHHRRLLLISIICVMGLSVVMFLALKSAKNPVDYNTSGRKSQAKATATNKAPLPKAVNYGLPVRLKIPKLAIDAPITYTGLTKTGDMAVPRDIADVGWYKNGALPGNKGSAVLAGHIDGLGGRPGVFADLDKLQQGDTLEVIDSNRKTISFTVRETRTYSEDAQPSEVFNATDAAHLNLITCTGTWDKSQRHYLERLVVFTDKSS